MDLQRKIDFAIKAYSAYDGNAYNCVYKRLFCNTMEEYEMKISGGLFPELRIDAKQCLEQYFGIEL